MKTQPVKTTAMYWTRPFLSKRVGQPPELVEFASRSLQVDAAHRYVRVPGLPRHGSTGGNPGRNPPAKPRKGKRTDEPLYLPSDWSCEDGS